MAANPLLNANRIFPPGMSWADLVNAESAERRAARRAAGRSRSRSRSRSAAPSSGNLRTDPRTGRVMIYTTQPAILASGERVRGHWFPAIDPEGDYGGPYHDFRQLLSDSRYRADMADIAKDQAAYSEWRAAQRGEAPAGAAGRARSRSRGRGRSRSRSGSGGRGATRRNRSRSRGRGRGRSRSRG